MLEQKFVNEYKKIYKDETGKDLSDEEAMEQATRLLSVVEMLYKPNAKDDRFSG